jgi:hypothetical protein
LVQEATTKHISNGARTPLDKLRRFVILTIITIVIAIPRLLVALEVRERLFNRVQLLLRFLTLGQDETEFVSRRFEAPANSISSLLKALARGRRVFIRLVEAAPGLGIDVVIVAVLVAFVVPRFVSGTMGRLSYKPLDNERGNRPTTSLTDWRA